LHENQTRGGVKGKMSYLAPEQLFDKPVDGRTDVFQLGICLHELLTGHRLFKGAGDHQRAVAVLEQPIPRPSELEPSLPPVVDEVILWALERDPERRPATADDFRRALESAALEVGQMSGHDLGGWMKSALADRLTERTTFERQCVAEMREGRSASGEAPAAHLRSVSGTSPPPAGAPGSQPGMAEVRLLPVQQRVGLSPAPDDGDSHSRYQQYQPQSGSNALPSTVASGRRLTAALVGFGVLLAVGIGIAWRVGGDGRPAAGAESAASKTTEAAARSGDAPATAPPPVVQPLQPATPGAADAAVRFEVAVTVVPSAATIELDGVEVGRGAFRTTLPVDGTRHILTVRADGYEEVGLDFTDRPPPARVVLDRARPARAGARPTRRPPPTARRPQRSRVEPPRTQDRESVITDNPDPWAEE
jgi:hypothetical protein